MVLKNFFFVIAFAGVFFACNNQDSYKKEDGSVDGEAVYKSNCQVCHGADGKRGASGANDLSVSDLALEERIEIIKEGSKNGKMMSFKHVLNEEEIKAVAEYIETLKED